MADNSNIIIKRIKKGGHGAHGGAWKVAYADFVTAMMAFFLLLWLLSSTSEDILSGIADYFAPTVGLKGGLGIGFEGGETPMLEGIKRGEWSNDAVVFGSPPDGSVVEIPETSSDVEDLEEQKSFTELEENISQAIESSPELREFKESVHIEQTPEGLKIEIRDQNKKPMFKQGGTELQPTAQRIFKKITELIDGLPNFISITGHTDAQGAGSTSQKGNWEVSAGRANAARRFMIQSGLDGERIARIIGKADFEPIDLRHPNAPTNRRISIILLKRSAIPDHKRAAPKGDLFSGN